MTREQIMARCEELDPIWQAMKEGKKFKLWDDKEDVFTEYLTGIDVEDLSTFRTEAGCFVYAEPIEPVYRVKDPVSLMQALVDGGYKYLHDNIWGKTDGSLFSGRRFEFCGKKVTGQDWRQEWLEEVYE